jgi:hypothetical protein
VLVAVCCVGWDVFHVPEVAEQDYKKMEGTFVVVTNFRAHVAVSVVTVDEFGTPSAQRQPSLCARPYTTDGHRSVKVKTLRNRMRK